MNNKLNLLIVVTIIGSLVGGAAQQSPAPIQQANYVEPGLLAGEAETLAVIVTAGDSAAAARAVERVGGQVTGDLWLIDAVAATVPTAGLNALALDPAIASIVADKGVETADGPDGWDRWVTQRRVIKGTYTLEDVQQTPVAYLPDGGFVSITGNGKVLIANADGSERARVSLTGGPFKTAAVVTGQGGTIFVAGEAERVYALNPDGSTRWVFRAEEKFQAGVALGPDGIVYVTDEKRNVYALDPATGQALWQFSADRDGSVVAAPTVGPDGALYVLTDKGYLYAINSDGSARWTFAARDGDPFKQSPQIGADGTIFIAGEDERVFAINPDGALKYEFATASKIKAQPALSADGSLYVAAEDRSLYGLNPDGTQRFLFRPLAGKFNTSPVLSLDGTTVYVAVKEKVLFAVDSASGKKIWQYTMRGDIQASPALDADGNVVLGSEGEDLVVLSPEGQVTTCLRLDDKVQQAPSVGPAGDVIVRVGDKELVATGYLPDHWDGRPDVEPVDLKRVWQLSNPVSIDVGADVLHDPFLPDVTPITGEGVVVAVLDSGVYHSDKIKDILGEDLDKHFLGQADFVGDGICHDGGDQYDSYCFVKKGESMDRYGHGSHVAGIIWSQITDYATGVTMGIAPDAQVLSVRVLGDDGAGSYADVIQGIQYVVEHQDSFNIGVLNVSLSAAATTPYFVDPLNQAVEAAWAAGIVVVAAAGNSGPGAETVTVPGNDPYVITVGAVDSQRTPGYWSDDILPGWSAAGPTLDGFVKPDVLAPGTNVVSFMYNDHRDVSNSARLVQEHPDYSATSSLFRMNGTSMATALTSGVVALMLQAHPELTPDQVKYRLMATARPSLAEEGDLAYNVFEQGMGRVWAPDAVLGDLPDGRANYGMNIQADLAHAWETEGDLAYHYQGPVRRALSDDGSSYLYYTVDGQGTPLALGVADADSMAWAGGFMAWAGGFMAWAGGFMAWAGALTEAGIDPSFMAWAGGTTWPGNTARAGGFMAWAGGFMAWAGGFMAWAGSDAWAGGVDTSAARVSSTTWVGDDWVNASRPPEGVTLAGFSYQPTANTDAGGDSDGTIVIVNKPQ